PHASTMSAPSATALPAASLVAEPLVIGSHSTLTNGASWTASFKRLRSPGASFLLLVMTARYVLRLLHDRIWHDRIWHDRIWHSRVRQAPHRRRSPEPVRPTGVVGRVERARAV